MLSFLMIIFAKYLFLLPIFIVLTFVILQAKEIRKKILLFAAISLPLTLIVAKILSYFYYDPRPFVVNHFTPLIPHVPDNGFPSDHALLSFALLFLVYVFNKKLGLVIFLLGILVGAARVYTGVHSFIDILGSFLISMVVASITYLLLKSYLGFSKSANQR